MKEVQRDRGLMPAAMELFKENQDIRFQMKTTAARINHNRGHNPIHPSLIAENNKNARLKMDRMKEGKRYKEGQCDAIMVLLNGKKSTIAYTREELLTDKYTTEGTWINGEPFFVITLESSMDDKINKEATRILGMWIDDVQVCCYGPTAFMRVDADGEFIPTTVAKFNEIVGSK
jgi:hypothetical protein